MIIDAEDQKKIDAWVAKFPEGKQASAVLMALKILQDRHGWLSDDALDAVAKYLDMSPSTVYEVVSFYSVYRRSPRGRFDLKVCTSLSCCLNGAEEAIQYIEDKLAIKMGGVSQDETMSLNEAECLGACQHAPVAILNDERYVHQLTPESIDALIGKLSQGKDSND